MTIVTDTAAKATLGPLRVLLVLSQPPLAEGSAAGRCAIAVVRGLRAAGHEVRVLAADYGRSGGKPPPDLEAEVVGIDPPPPGWGARAGRALRPRARLGESDAFVARANALSSGVDVVHLEEVDAAAARIAWPVPVVAHLHFLAASDQDVRRAWDPVARAGLEFSRAERWVLRHRPRLVASSEPVAAMLRARGAAHVDVVPLGLDPATYGAPATVTEPVAGLIGTGAWPPTRDAIDALVGDVWPRVRRAVPDARLELAGRGVAGTDDVSGGVRWRGEVPSSEEFLRGLGVLLYPVRRGSGTKVKVLEAMALGVPVVTTPSGAEGIAPNDGVLVADDAATLAASAADLLRDPAARAETGAAARRHFLEHHAPPALATALEPVYAAALR